MIKDITNIAKLATTKAREQLKQQLSEFQQKAHNTNTGEKTKGQQLSDLQQKVNNLQQKVNNFNVGGKTKEQQLSELQQKVHNTLGINQMKFNPFLDKNGELVNPFLNYQKLLDSNSISQKAKEYITQATGLSPTATTSPTQTYTPTTTSVTPNFNPNYDGNSLYKLDVTTELPKLSEKQIAAIISQHFGKSTVITPSDAKGIYEAQQKSNMSALAILGIGALESGYGTSEIAKAKNNLWGWNATNSNPAGNAKTFSPVSQGALEFANSFLRTYYNKYGAKSIYAAGTGNNPAGKGYAYDNNGNISTSWATNVGSIMTKFYNTAKTVG